MMRNQELTLKRLYIAPDNYHEFFISDNTKPKYEYNECRLMERVIDGQKHINIYVLEPNQIYKCKIGQKITNYNYCNVKLKSYIAQSGIILLYADMDDNCIYITNNGNNLVYIQKDSIIASCDFIQR